MNTQKVLEKYFKEGKQLFFHSSDELSSREGDTYLRYAKAGTIELWFGGNSGEVCIYCTHNGENLERIIKALIS